jgi:hypothetical protein
MKDLQVLDIAWRFMYVDFLAAVFQEISISEAYGDTACMTDVHAVNRLCTLRNSKLCLCYPFPTLHLVCCSRSKQRYRLIQHLWATRPFLIISRSLHRSESIPKPFRQ